jgi:N-glycosylase/DNA lyase
MAEPVLLAVRDYDLAATLDSGQAFRWHRVGPHWQGVIRRQAVRLTPVAGGILVETGGPAMDLALIRHYLQTDTDLAAIRNTFPDDAPMNAAVAACPGLRLLRQDPWECLASFILSATKQIVQIRQIVALLCERFGDPLVPLTPRAGEVPEIIHAFPTPERLVQAGEGELRACKMGFRAPHLLGAACAVAEGRLNLECLRALDYAAAREQLMTLHGVGGKIADCVLLFAYGFDQAFPVDVWIERALQEWYFPRRRASERRLRHFAATHFGPHAGYAQQYLFHHMRTRRPAE